jgi:DNA adenine methylase
VANGLSIGEARKNRGDSRNATLDDFAGRVAAIPTRGGRLQSEITQRRSSRKTDATETGSATSGGAMSEIPQDLFGGDPRRAQPFLKWAGGKTQLLEQFAPYFPESITSYCEPFVGGGAVFFHLKARFPKMRAKLCDINAELINSYEVTRDRPNELMARLDEHLKQFMASRKQYYYSVRGQHRLTGPIERAARMIFLNKTCFNGLYRVNGSGEFNVPLDEGKLLRSCTLYDPANILACSQALQGTELIVQDFRQTLRKVCECDFVYVDPPYLPRSETANFTSYTKQDFGKAEHEALAAMFFEATKRSAKLMLSNSDTPFTRQLYTSANVKTVQARRAINSDATKRGPVTELLALSWE